jgi:dihydrodipicolinate synthase/N-acetylneuraminate lyase
MTDIINPAVEQPTAEQIAKHYSAALDSVALINSTKPERTSDEEWADTISRNKEHLNIMLAKDFWTTEDLTAIKKAAK